MPPRALQNTILATLVTSNNASIASSLLVPLIPISKLESN